MARTISLSLYMYTRTDKSLLTYPHIETYICAYVFFFALNPVIKNNIQCSKIRKLQKTHKLPQKWNRINILFKETKKITEILSSILSFYFVMIYYAISKLIPHFIKSFNTSGVQKTKKRAQPADLLSIY